MERDIICPICECGFEADDEALYTNHCPSCGLTFRWDYESNDDYDPVLIPIWENEIK